MSNTTEVLVINVAAGATVRLERGGRYLEVIDAAAAFDLYLSDANGGRTEYVKGALSGLYLQGAFSAMELVSATAQTITVLVTDGSGGTRRQPGVVRVVDEGAYKTSQGRQYFASVTRNASSGAVGVIAGLQAVGVRIAIKRMSVTSSIAGTLGVFFGAAAPAVAGGTNGGPASKLFGAPIAQALRVYGDSATGVPTLGELPGLQLLANVYSPANTYSELPMTTPIILPVGSCIVVASNAVNRDVNMLIDFEAID